MEIPEDIISPRGGLERTLRTERRYGNLTKWALLFLSVLALRLWFGVAFSEISAWLPIGYAIVIYGITNIVFTFIFAPPWVLRHMRLPRLPTNLLAFFLFLSSMMDYGYVCVLIGFTGGAQSDFFLLFILLAIKGAVYYPYVREPAFLSFLSGPLWILASYVYSGSLSFVFDLNFSIRYGTLFLSILGCLTIGWLMERRQAAISSLGANLSVKSEDLEAQARLAQQTAGELANRLLELRSLQEGVRAINSSLALEELLQRIADNATEVLRDARCTIALLDERGESVVTSAISGPLDGESASELERADQSVASWVVQNRRSLLSDSIGDDPRFAERGRRRVASIVSVPLVSDNQVIGALTATRPSIAAFTEADLNLLDAFGGQAVVAVKNARLYEQLVQEEKETARLYQSVLEKSDELEAVLRGIGDGVIVVDPQLRLLMMNPVAARIFSILQTPTPGVRLPELVSNEALLTLASDTSIEQAPLIREIVLDTNKDDEQVLTYQVLSSAVTGIDGQIRGVVMVMRDITTQKEIERMKSNFLSVVSHELRTPLHSIKGFVDIILMGKTGPINDLQRDFLTTVKDATSNLQRLIDDLLEFSRMEAGQIRLRPQMISVYDIALTVVEQLTPLAEENKLQLINQVPEDIALVEADPMRIGQVMTNLVSNAIKFTPAEGTIVISAHAVDGQVQVSVRDTGIGIPAEEQDKVFQRFYQVDSSATRSYRGAGLGLTICKFIVEYHHGRIWVESQVGEGSTFHFALPMRLPQDEDLVIDFTVPAARKRP